MNKLNLCALSALIILTLPYALVAMNGQEQPAQQRSGFFQRNAGRMGLAGLLLGGLGFLMYRNRDRVRAALNSVTQRFTGNKLNLEQMMQLVDEELANMPSEVPQADQQKLRRDIGQAFVDACAQKGSNKLPEEEVRQIITDKITDFAHAYIQKQQEHEHAQMQKKSAQDAKSTESNGGFDEQELKELPSQEEQEAQVRKVGARKWASCRR